MRILHSTLAGVLLSLTIASVGQAQIVTNWAAYNDHRPGPIIPPHVPTATSWGTALRVTTYDMGAPNETLGVNLTNFLNGQQLPVTMTVNRTTAPDDFGTVVTPFTNTPAGDLFFRVCDLSNSGIVGVDAGDNDFVTFTFNNLNPDKRYVFRGTSARGNNYALRWSVVTLTGARDWIDAHVNGAGGPGVITSNNFPADLGPGQAAWNSGHNREGAVIGWDFISPAIDGSFSLIVSQYVGNIPGGLVANDPNYGYSFGAILLAEVEASPPVITTNPPALTTVLQNRPFSLSVSASGTPLLYQWYKQGVGAIPGATMRTYSVSQAAFPGDTGDYFVVVYNPLASRTSTVARVNVTQDLASPSTETALSFPSFDMGTQVATLDQVIVEFNETIQAASAGNPSQYLISGGVGNPVSVTVTNNRAAILKLAAPLAQDTTYNVTVTGVLDLAGNNISGGTNNPAPFRTWALGACNGLLFEAFNTGAGVTVDILTSSPNFPNNPSFRTNIWAFDTRVAYPDDSHGAYGSRVRGLFIPPFSGNWVFFLRAWDRGQFFINPNGLDPAGKQQLLEELTGGNPRNWNKIISQPIPLKAGKGYYIESLLQADTTGIDALKVAVRFAGTGTPQPNDTPDNIVDTNSMMGPFVGFPLMPRGIAGSFMITQQPADVSTEANMKAVFSIVVNAPQAPYICYQWQRSDDGGVNYVDIPGATKASYETPYLTVADDNGDRYRVVTGIPGESQVSAVARLTVGPDRTRPRVTRVLAINYTNIVVYYSEPLPGANSIPPGTVDDQTAYSLDDPQVFVGAAVISPTNPLRIDLYMDPLGAGLELGKIYTLRVSTDATPIFDANNNFLDPNPTFVTFRAQQYDGNPETLTTMPTNGVLPVGALTTRGFAGRLVQMTTAKPNGNDVSEAVLAGAFLDPLTGLPALNIAPAPSFYETNIINYNRDASLEPPGASVGSLTPDLAFPGYTTNHTNFDNMVMEVVAYLHLQPGIYRFGVSSDDGFRVTPASSVLDPNNAIILGEFNGGRGQPNETLFDFLISREGLYPFRLTWEQGNGGANVEWWEVDLDAPLPQPRLAINASTTGLAGPPGGGPPAFTPPCTPKTMSVSIVAANLVVQWPLAGGGNLFTLQGTASLNPAIAWANVPQAPVHVGGNKRVTIPLVANQNRFYRLFKAAPPNCN